MTGLNRFKTPLMLAGALTLAWLFSAVGARIQAGFPAKQAAIMLMFFCTGAALSTTQLRREFRQVKLHLVAQLLIFGLFPLVVSIILLLPGRFLNEQLILGLFALASVPTTISSCVVFTSLAGGSTAVALFNAVGSNILGIVLSPLLFMLLIRTNAVPFKVDAGAVFFKLLQLVALPFALGQGVRISRMAATWADKNKGVLMRINVWATMFIVYLAFCSIFSGARLPISPRGMAGLLGGLLTLHILMLTTSFGLTRILKLEIQDCIALGFVGSQKTLAMGLPLVIAFCAGNTTLEELAVLPVIFYHPTQLVVASFLVEPLRALIPEERSSMEEAA